MILSKKREEPEMAKKARSEQIPQRDALLVREWRGINHQVSADCGREGRIQRAQKYRGLGKDHAGHGQLRPLTARTGRHLQVRPRSAPQQYPSC